MSRVKTISKEDGERIGIDKFPNFHVSGSISGMKKLYYGKDALLVKCGSYIYNVSSDQDIYYEKAYEDGGEIDNNGMYKNGGKTAKKYFSSIVNRNPSDDNKNSFETIIQDNVGGDRLITISSDVDESEVEKILKALNNEKFKKGGTVDSNSYRYLTLEKTKNGLKIIINEEGKQELRNHEIKGEEIYFEPFFSDLFEDVQGNSELLYFSDAGEAGLGLTSAPSITDGYYYDDDGDLTDKGHKDSEVYWYPNYQIKDFSKELLDNGEVFFEKADKFEKGGEVFGNPSCPFETLFLFKL